MDDYHRSEQYCFIFFAIVLLLCVRSVREIDISDNTKARGVRQCKEIYTNSNFSRFNFTHRFVFGLFVFFLCVRTAEVS